LTTILTPISILSTWTAVEERVKDFMVFFLLLEVGMVGVFLAQDLFLFYIFWEFTLIPMYFLIGIWGGPRKEYAAIKFFLYTLFGSVLMLIAILMLYFNSDLRKLPADQLLATGVVSPQLEESARQAKVQEILGADRPVPTYSAVISYCYPTRASIRCTA
jgi:NADH-quinone oxidoreductase subunit M